MKVCDTTHTEIVFDDSLNTCPYCVLIEEIELRRAEVTKYKELLNTAFDFCKETSIDNMNDLEVKMFIKINKACATLRKKEECKHTQIHTHTSRSFRKVSVDRSPCGWEQVEVKV